MASFHEALSFAETGDASSSQAASSTVEVGLALTGYCNQLISPELNNVVADMLQRLRILQDHALCFKPFKGEPQRWYVRGLREVRKAARQQRAKSIVMAPNIEQVEVKGGSLSTTVNSILTTCKEHGIPVVFALSRKKMGDVYGCHKRMSAIAIIDTTGIEDLHTHILQLTSDLRTQWEEQYQLWKQSHEEAASTGHPVAFNPTPLMRYTQSLMMDDACSNSSGSPSYRAASDDAAGQQHSFRMRMGGMSADISGRDLFRRPSRPMGPMLVPAEYMQAGRLMQNRQVGQVLHPDAWTRHGPPIMAPSALMPHPSPHIALARPPGPMAHGPMVEWRYAPRPHAPARLWPGGMPHSQMVMQGPHGPGPSAGMAAPGGPPPVDVDACLANLAGLTLDTPSGSMPAVQVRFESWADGTEPGTATVMEQHASGKVQGRPGPEWQTHPGVARGSSKPWQQPGRHYQVAGLMSHANPASIREGYPAGMAHAVVPVQGAEMGPMGTRLHPNAASGMVAAPSMHGGYYTVAHPHAVMPHASGVGQEHVVNLREYMMEQWSDGNSPPPPVPPSQGHAVMMASGQVGQEQQVVYLMPHQE